MKFTKIIKNKDMIQYVSVFLTILLIIVLQLFTGSIDEQSETETQFAEMIVSSSETINNSSNLFFTLTPALNAIINYNNIEGIKNILILFIETFAIYFIICAFISKTYIKAVTRFSSLGNKKGKKINLTKDFKTNKLWKTYVQKEFKLLIRNPIFFMQCVLPSIIFPFIFAIPIIVAVKQSDPDIMRIYSEFLLGDINTSIGLAISLVIILILYIFNFIALTAISREGKDSVFIKQIPVALDKQILYKILPGIIMNVIPTVFVIVVEKVLVNNFSIEMMLAIFITAMTSNVFNNYLMILIDLKNPKLNWTTEYAVVKQNFNMIFQFIIIAIQCGIVIAVCSNLSLQNSMLLLPIVFIIGIVLVRKYVSVNQIKLFNKIN